VTQIRNQVIGGAEVLLLISPGSSQGFITSELPLTKAAAMLLATYIGNYRHVSINGDTVRLCDSTEARIREMCVYIDLEGAIIITHTRMADESEEYRFHGHVDHVLYALTLGRRLGIESPRMIS
jgi:hypothetical protein